MIINMFAAERIRSAEQEFRFRYPNEFLDIAPELEAIVATSAFASAFPGGRLVAPKHLSVAWTGRLPPTLVPFMCQGNLGIADHYCFHKSAAGSGLPVVVFADHAVVYDWDDYEVFLKWVRHQCSIVKA
jgi:hypothetical protein